MGVKVETKCINIAHQVALGTPIHQIRTFDRPAKVSLRFTLHEMHFIAFASMAAQHVQKRPRKTP